MNKKYDDAGGPAILFLSNHPSHSLNHLSPALAGRDNHRDFCLGDIDTFVKDSRGTNHLDMARGERAKLCGPFLCG